MHSQVERSFSDSHCHSIITIRIKRKSNLLISYGLHFECGKCNMVMQQTDSQLQQGVRMTPWSKLTGWTDWVSISILIHRELSALQTKNQSIYIYHLSFIIYCLDIPQDPEMLLREDVLKPIKVQEMDTQNFHMQAKE